MTTIIDFKNLATGTVVDNPYSADGVTISATGLCDLTSGSLENAPTDSEGDARFGSGTVEGGGAFTFTFEGATRVESLTFVDTEEGARVRFLDAEGTEIERVTVATTCDNRQRVQNFDVEDVYRMEVALNGSGSIDDLAFSMAAPDGDGDGSDGSKDRDGGLACHPKSARTDTFDAVPLGHDLKGEVPEARGLSNCDDNSDLDILNLAGQGLFYLDNVKPDSRGNGIGGTVVFVNSDGKPTGLMLTFSEVKAVVGDEVKRVSDASDDTTTNSAANIVSLSGIENVTPCFTPGTLIATPRGERPVEDLVIGDRVITRDNGIQVIRWVGARNMSSEDLARAKHLRPVRIQQGALGAGLPERDMYVSPQHRVLVANDKTALYFDETEVLVAAQHLTKMDGIDVVDVPDTTYIHVMFDHHEVILSDGAWTESFQPGDQTLASMGKAQRSEIIELFPELETAEGLDAYSMARRSLKQHEADLVIE